MGTRITDVRESGSFASETTWEKDPSRNGYSGDTSPVLDGNM